MGEGVVTHGKERSGDTSLAHPKTPNMCMQARRGGVLHGVNLPQPEGQRAQPGSCGVIESNQSCPSDPESQHAKPQRTHMLISHEGCATPNTLIITTAAVRPSAQAHGPGGSTRAAGPARNSTNRGAAGHALGARQPEAPRGSQSATKGAQPRPGQPCGVTWQAISTKPDDCDSATPLARAVRRLGTHAALRASPRQPDDAGADMKTR